MMGILRYAIVYMKGNIIDPSTPSFESFALLTYYYLLLYCFGNSWRISGINEYFNIINRSKNIKFCNFCVKALYLTTQCILFAVQCFYLRGNKDPSALLSTRDKRVAITFQENQILNLGNHYHKYATQVALEILEKF